MSLRSIRAALLFGTLSACATVSGPGLFVPTRDPLTRTIGIESGEVLRAAAASIREYGFVVPEPAPGAVRVYSEPVTIQSSWRGDLVAERIVCGVGTAADSDPLRLRQVSNAIPIQIRLGYELEPRQGATATRLIFHAEGRRSGPEYFATPTMPCTLTLGFVEELFDGVERQLAVLAAR